MKEVILILLGVCFHISTPARNLFTNTWSIKTFAGEEFARNISQRYGFSFQGLATSFDDYHILRLDTLGNTTDVNMANITKKLMEHDEIMWAGQLKVKPVTYGPRRRPKKEKERSGSETVHRSFRANTHQGPPPRRNTAQPTTPATSYFTQQPYRGPTRHVGISSGKTSAYATQFQDPLWTAQWYAHDYRTALGPVMDHNLVPVYRSLDGRGRPITGEGVTIAIVDADVDANHPDLRHSVQSHLSFDFLSSRPGFAEPHIHGTRVAGIVAMAANNNYCGVGVAYGARIAALKIFGGPQPGTDYTYGAALGYSRNSIDIYSNSWCLQANGKTLERSSHMERESIRRGVLYGRNGKGNIYVFSSGNNKQIDISCAFQDQGSQQDLIVVGSASSRGKVTSYSEACPNVFAATYSDEDGEEGVVTTEPNGKCTKTFGGTSASVSIASGIIALVLQANPNLGYRDIQHLITMSAEVAPLANNRGTWDQNSAGFWVSQDFGFGLMNAENMVNLAKGWSRVRPQVTCEGVYNISPPKQFSSAQLYALSLAIDACENTNKAITFLERVTLTFDIEYPGRRGDLSVTLMSPNPDKNGMATEVVLIQPRPNDDSTYGFKGWSVTSVQTWGENPKGNWIVTVRNVNNRVTGAESSKSGQKRKNRTLSKEIFGTISSLKLTFHGLTWRPIHMANGPRNNYSGFRIV